MFELPRRAPVNCALRGSFACRALAQQVDDVEAGVALGDDVAAATDAGG